MQEAQNKYGLTLEMSPDGMRANIARCTELIYDLDDKLDVVKEKIGKVSVDEESISKVRHELLIGVDEATRATILTAVSDFRQELLNIIRDDRTTVFLIQEAVNEVVDTVDGISNLVISETIPNQRQEERNELLGVANEMFSEIEVLKSLETNFENFYKMTDPKLTELRKEFSDIETSDLKDGTRTVKLPRTHDPKNKFGDNAKKDDVLSLALAVTHIDGEEVNLTLNEFNILYYTPHTNKFSPSAVRKKMDTRQNAGEFKYKDVDDNEHTVKWAKVAL